MRDRVMNRVIKSCINILGKRFFEKTTVKSEDTGRQVFCNLFSNNKVKSKSSC